MLSNPLAISNKLSVLALLGLACATEPGVPADLVLRGGKVVTVDESNPEGQAIAVKGDTILAVGSNREIRRYIGAETEVIELDGALVIPGFVESHAHLLGLGNAQLQLDLMEVENWDEVITMVASVAQDAPAGALIRGRGWHQEKWDRVPEGAVRGFPTHQRLSAVSANNPVVLTHASGHAVFANAAAMAAAGITDATPDPAGGEIIRDESGEAIGLFNETAQRLIRPAIDGAEPVSARRRAELAIEESLSRGITSFHDAGSPFETIDLYREMAEDGSLRLRLYAMIRDSNEDLAAHLDEYRMVNYRGRLTVRTIKRTLDGALGSRGAWLLEDYADLPGHRGFNTTPVESVEETARLAIEHGYQMATHAIGDRGNRETLDIYERTFALHPELTDLRWRIEHAQHLHPDDIPRFAEMGVIASMEGIHATSDAPWVFVRLGRQRAEEGAYVWQKLLQSGAVVTNGTDAPVERVDPIPSFYATVARRTIDGSVFFPDQRMSRLEALRSYTLSGAYAAFQDDVTGSLTPGKLADITVLNRDIMTVPEDEIPGTEVLYTIVGGRIEYRMEGR